MPKAKTETANIEAISKLVDKMEQPVSQREIVALTMRECGSTYEQIGRVFDATKQYAEQLVKGARERNGLK